MEVRQPSFQCSQFHATFIVPCHPACHQMLVVHVRTGGNGKQMFGDAWWLLMDALPPVGVDADKPPAPGPPFSTKAPVVTGPPSGAQVCNCPSQYKHTFAAGQCPRVELCHDSSSMAATSGTAVRHALSTLHGTQMPAAPHRLSPPSHQQQASQPSLADPQPAPAW